jgi:hypothetical protein
LFCGSTFAEEKQLIFLDCKHDYATSSKDSTPQDIMGQFSFTINKESSSTNITAISSEDDVAYEGKSTPNKYLLNRMVVKGGIVMIEQVSIDRINGQMINETKMFVPPNTDAKKPNAVTKFYINCEVAKTKF